MTAPLHHGRNRNTLASGLRHRRLRAAACGALAGLVLGGCAGSALDTSMLGPTTAALKLPDVPALPNIELPKPADPVLGTPTEVYERVGRGAVTCWFGAHGPLKGTHIYEATADSPHKGGQAEISIREREVAPQEPPAPPAAGQKTAAPAARGPAAAVSPPATPTRGAKVFRVSIRPEGEDRASVDAENLKLPEDLARRIKANVEAWSTGKDGCEAGIVATEASPAAGAATAAAAGQPVATPTTAAATKAPAPKAAATGKGSSNDKATHSERMAGSGRR